MRFANRLEAKGVADRYEPFIKKLPSIILMTGMFRACCTVLVVLAVFHTLETMATSLNRTEIYLWVVLISGVIVCVFIVALPASLGRYYREKLVVLAMPILNLITSRPVAWIPRGLRVFDPVVRRLSGHDQDQDEQDVSDELMSVVEESDFAAHVDEDQRDILEAVFDMPNTDAADLMTPRTEVSGIELGLSFKELIEQIIEIGHSRIPVYEESLDRIIGVLYVKDLLPMLTDGVTADAAFDVRSILREPYLVPEGKKISELISDFKALKIQMALVLDEYGGTSGLITVEDIMEEFVGDMQDEYETKEEPDQITRIAERIAEVDARTHIGMVNDELELSLPDDDNYDTLGGFIFDRLGHIPGEGEAFDDEGVRFTVMAAERTRVNRVRIEWGKGVAEAG